ncbi:hypothetical protein MNAN1_000527 [Malassezia nana]|uniref:Tip elongation aberrant protein 1 n=1 Tax=Malassezia nana TaxID=180528 RepID=A0AAF0J166_9BASI|nr:hypothetical protein MNAN1_000527 [Malassezia nana]
MAIFGKKRSDKDRVAKHAPSDSMGDASDPALMQANGSPGSRAPGRPGLVSRIVSPMRSDGDSQEEDAQNLLRSPAGDLDANVYRGRSPLRPSREEPRQTASSVAASEGIMPGLGTMPPPPSRPAPVPVPSGGPAAENAPAPSAAPPAERTRAANVVYPWGKKYITMNPPRFLDETRRAPPGVLSPPPFPRYGHATNQATSSNNEVYIFGGLVRDSVKNDMYILRVEPVQIQRTSGIKMDVTLQATLVQTSGHAPLPRVGHAAVLVSNVFILWGGDTKIRADDVQDDALYLLNLNNREWTRVAAPHVQGGPGPVGRYGHTLSILGSNLFVFGGQLDDDFFDELWRFDLNGLKETPTWQLVRPATGGPPRRTGHSAVVYKERLYIFGGTDGHYHYNDTWCFDWATQSWSELKCVGYIPAPREGHAACMVDDIMYIFGGRGVDGHDLGDLASFKISSHRWFMFAHMGPAPFGRSGHTMVSVHNRVLVVGGEAFSGDVHDEPTALHVLDTTKIKYPVKTDRPPASAPVPAPTPMPPSAPMPADAPAPKAEAPPAATETRSTPLAEAPPPPSDPGSDPAVPVQELAAASSAAGPPPPDASVPRTAPVESTPVVEPEPAPVTPSASVTTPVTAPTAAPIAAVPPPFSPSVPAMLGAPMGAPTTPAAPAPDTPSSVRSGAMGAAPEGPTPRSPWPRAPSSASVVRTPSGARARTPASEAHARVPIDGSELPMSAVGSVQPRKLFSDEGGPLSQSTPATSASTRELWLLSMLSLAVKQGFVPPARPASNDEPLEMEQLDTGAEHSEKEVLVKTMLTLKAQATMLRADLQRQLRNEEERVAAQERARVAALQEAAFYRAKLAANESGPPDERHRLERQRVVQLEKLLSHVTREHGELERKVAMLVDQAKLEARLRQLAEDRLGETTKRALAAEESHLQVYEQYSALQKHSYETESMLRDHAAQISTLTSRLAAQQVERDTLEDKMTSTTRSVDTNRAMMAQFQEALNAAHARTSEYERQRLEHQRQTETQNALILQLRTEVQSKAAEVESKNQQIEQQASVMAELESMVSNLQREATTHREAATGGLAQLLAMQSVSAAPPEEAANVSQLSHVQALQEEAQALRALHDEAKTSLAHMAVTLQQATDRSHQLQRTNNQLFAEVTSQRKQLAAALHDLSTLRDASQTTRADDQHAARELEAAQVRTMALRQLLSEHQVEVPDDDTLASPDFVQSRRITQLQRELDSYKRAAQRNALDLQRAQDQLHRLGQEWEAHRRQGTVASQEELAQLRLRAEEAERRLIEATEAHEQRTSQLENDYLTAVQFVRNTENMLRRLKDEHVKLRQDNAELRARAGPVSPSAYRSP